MKEINYIGLGIGYREEISDQLYANASKIDCVEVITERYANRRNLEELKELTDNFYVIPHGVSLSIGSKKLDLNYLSRIKAVLKVINCSYYSDHLCMTKSSGIDIGHLAPICFTEEKLKNVIKNVKIVQDYFEMPLILENITYKFEIPGKEMTQEEFFSRLVFETNCGLLIDVANLHANSYNHGFNPYQYIDDLPLANTTQVHLAGGVYDKKGELIDSHNRGVERETFELFEYLTRKSKIKSIILEHDDNFPDDITILLKQLDIARNILNKLEWKEQYKLMVEETL
ncbi:MAG: DUF692 domain-containing protein [Gammaproteobacteria bacterium]